MVNQKQAENIAKLYGKALANYDDFGTFQLALNNAMNGRTYNWDIDQFERVLTVMVKLGCSTNPARMRNWRKWDERMGEIQ